MRTALYSRHCALAAKMVDFCGWEMPVQYAGIIPEHCAVRKAAGLFDVSHMGRILIHGTQAQAFLDYLATNEIGKRPDLSATYTVLCNESGGSVDDVIIYKQDNCHFFVIVNAGNRQKDLHHFMLWSKKFDVQVQDRYSEDGILAIQGPLAIGIVQKIFPQAAEIKPMHFLPVSYNGEEVILSRTGYTGAGGFEIYASNGLILDVWEQLLEEGHPEGLVPIGLGARDTLRLEMGFALYGHELSDHIAPTESVSAWTVKWEKGDFLGRAVLQKLEGHSDKRSEYGIELCDQGIARADYEVFQGQNKIGVVTSGTQSPTLNKAIAIVLVKGELQVGDMVDVQIRQKRCRAQVVPLPFLSKHQ